MSFTNAQLAQQIANLIEYWSEFNEEYSNWVGGSVGGGPNSDGEYPLTNWAGLETLLACPAQLADDVSGAVADAETAETNAAASASAASTSETNAATSETNAETFKDAAAASAAAASVDEGLADSSATVATAQANLATARAGYAEEWAVAAEDVLISSAAGGDESTDYSALHHATKAAASASAASTSETNAAASEAAAATFDPALYAALADDETVTGQYTFSHASGILIGAAPLTATLIGQWNTAYGWGDHSSAGYLTSESNDMPLGADREGSPYFDIDDQKTDGIYKMNSAGNHANTPGTLGYGTLTVIDNSDVHSQQYMAREDNGRLYIRTQTGDFSGAWNRVWSDADFDFADYATLASPTFTGGVYIGGDLNHNDVYLDVAATISGAHGIRLLNSSDTTQGYYYSNGSGTSGLLHSTGGWAVQVSPAGAGVNLYGTTVNLQPSGNINLQPSLNVQVLGGKQMRVYNSGNTIYSQLSADFLHIDGKEAIDGNDTYLRLNQNGDFTNGIYSPGAARFDGGLNIGTSGTPVQIDAAGNGYWAGKQRHAYGIDGGYADVSGNTTFGATIWSLSDSYTGAAAGNSSASTSLYGIKWIRGTHPDTDSSAVGEGLAGYFNGTQYWHMGTSGLLLKGSNGLYFNDTNTRVDEGSGNAVRVTTDSGYVEIGAQNSSYGHIITDRSDFYFNKPTRFAGAVKPHASATYSLGASTLLWQNLYTNFIQLGHASDTTIGRTAAGKVEVEGKSILQHASSSYDSGDVTFSTSAPSGGSNGDIWFEYT